MRLAQKHKTSNSRKQSAWPISNYRPSHLCSTKIMTMYNMTLRTINI